MLDVYHVDSPIAKQRSDLQVDLGRNISRPLEIASFSFASTGLGVELILSVLARFFLQHRFPLLPSFSIHENLVSPFLLCAFLCSGGLGKREKHGFM